MSESKAERAARVKHAHNALDTAICEYMDAKGQSGIVTSWTMAVGTALIEDGEEYDGFKAISSSSISRWTAIGLLRTALNSAEHDGLIPTTDDGDGDE